MKILLIGLGSIGQRHLRNIKKINPNTEIYALRKLRRGFILNNSNQIVGKNIIKKYDIKEIRTIKEIKKINLDAVFINTPSSLHLKYFQTFLNQKLHIFIEKPLTDKSHKAKIFINQINHKYKQKIMIGHQLRFNECLIKIKSILKKGTLGKICGANIYHGENLNNFHIYEKYNNIYASKKKLGGGVILSQIHEIDYCLYLFGSPSSLYASGGQRSDLKIDVEDYANIVFNFNNDKDPFSVNITLDYLQNPKKRELLIVGSKGSLEWDYYKDTININYYNGSNESFIYKLKDRNELFMRELKYFFKSIENDTDIRSDFTNAYKCLQIVEKIKHSIKSNKVINLN